MRSSLIGWIGDADRLRHLDVLDSVPPSFEEDAIRRRIDDLYIALVGELFDLMRSQDPDSADCARVGNAFIDIADNREGSRLLLPNISRADARLFGAAAFYFGGFPASALLSVQGLSVDEGTELELACSDLLGRRRVPRSGLVRRLLGALYNGDLGVVEAVAADAVTASAVVLAEGPTEWIPARLFEQLVKRFQTTNVRAVLPDGQSAQWTPLVESLLNRSPAAWEFFPSQIGAINGGLLTRTETYSLQMPTGAGKTALCETLLYWHARSSETSAAVLLVPYRSLAAELRGTVVKRLNEMGVSAGCVYGGTVPTGDEVRAVDQMRALVATPEALSGVLSADPRFLERISLVICDEGHLLDGGSRGISLELLLARLRARPEPRPRCVFVSAIVPNIEEINTWLGGSNDSVIRSDYRAAIAEFGVLRSTGTGEALLPLLRCTRNTRPPRAS
jgi:helicase